MKKIKRLTALILTVIMVFSMFTILPITVNAADKVYSLSILDDGTAEITGYTGNIANLVIQSKIYGYKITGIGAYAFRDCSFLKTVTIPNSVTIISNNAFYYCDNLTTVTVPNSVKSIGKCAFAGCDKLKAMIIPNSVTSIGDSAFKYCYSLTAITIPDSVTSIGNSAFEYCNSLATLKISASVKNIGEDVFKYCNRLSTITVDEKNQKYDSRNNCNAIIETKTNTLLYGSLNTVIPDSVTRIGNNAFYSFKDLETITIPDSVKSIGNSAFFSCENLTTLTIPNSVKSIGDYAFQYCQGLKTITIPESVTSIGDSVFWGCNVITAYVYKDSYAHKYVVDNNVRYKIIEPQPEVVLGDVNFDGKINVLDATAIQKYSVGQSDFDDNALASADANKDGTVNIMDSTLIQKYAVGLVSEF